jgi:hypothetical protein
MLEAGQYGGHTINNNQLVNQFDISPILADSQSGRHTTDNVVSWPIW